MFTRSFVLSFFVIIDPEKYKGGVVDKDLVWFEQEQDEGFILDEYVNREWHDDCKAWSQTEKKK